VAEDLEEAVGDSAGSVEVRLVAAARVGVGDAIKSSGVAHGFLIGGDGMEALLTELVARLKAAAADNLTAAVLYGSGVTGEFHAGHSDLNVLCIVEHAGVLDLEKLHAPAEWWIRQGHPAPLVFTMEELRRSADIFAIELMDMKQHHRMLFGDDFFGGLVVPMGLHRLQVERELRAGWLRLRGAVITSPQKKKEHLGIMLASVSTFCTLFRHAMVVLGHPMPASKRDAVDGIAKVAGANPAAFYAILDLRAGKRKPGEDVEETLHGYLEFVEVVANEVDRGLEGK
jgi:hypothetical protein